MDMLKSYLQTQRRRLFCPSRKLILPTWTRLEEQRNLAFQDSTGYVAGSALTWKSSGGTYAITCTSLAATTGTRQGGKTTTSLVQAPPGGSTAVLPDYLQFILQLQFTAAPTAGGEVELWLGWSDSLTAGTDNQGGLSGTDAAGPNADVKGLLAYVGSLVASNSLGTGVQPTYFAPVIPRDIAFSPVIFNTASQAFDATAGHTILTCVPYYRERQT